MLFADGSSSAQVDVLVLKPSYPLGLRTEKYIFAGGVIAAFECKLTVRPEHIKRAFQVAQDIKRKAPIRNGSPYEELNCTPIFGLLAHSHALGKGRPSWKLHEVVEKYQVKFAEHPRELLDVICVADAATLPVSKSVLRGSDLDKDELAELEELETSWILSTMYTIHDEAKELGFENTGTVLAGLIHDLTHRIAFEDPTIRDWAEHLSTLGFYGGIGRPIYGTLDELSPTTLKVLREKGQEDQSWSKWNKHLP